MQHFLHEIKLSCIGYFACKKDGCNDDDHVENKRECCNYDDHVAFNKVCLMTMLPEEGQLQLLCSCFMPKRMLQLRWPSYIQEYVYVAIRMIMLHAKRTVAMMMAMLHASWDVAIHSFCCMQDGRWLSAMQPVSEPSTSTPRPSLTRCTKQNQIYNKNYQMNM